MYKFIAFIALCFGILALISVAFTAHAYINHGGVAVLFFQLWAILSSICALVLGALSRWFSHRTMMRHALPAKLGIFSGTLALVIYAALLQFLR